MRFDIVIGNPPYQEVGGTLGDRSSSIFQYFVDLGDKLSKNLNVLIIPSRWMLTCPRGISTNWVEYMRSRTDFTYVIDYLNSLDCFDNIHISGGVCYFVIKKNYKGLCRRTIIREGESYEILDKLSYEGVVIRNSLAFDIINKIKSIEGDDYSRFSDIVTPARFYTNDDETFNTNWLGFSLEKTPEYCVKYFCNHKATEVDFGYVSYNQMTKNKDTVKYPKILISSSGDNKQIIGKIFYAGVDCICSRTYIPILSSTYSEEEILHVLSYMKTKFFRYTVSIMKVTHRISRKQFMISPLQNFSSESDIDWSQSIADIDKQLYKKYRLTKNEISYIEQNIKAME